VISFSDETRNRGVNDPQPGAGAPRARLTGVVHASVPLHLWRNRGQRRHTAPPHRHNACVLSRARQTTAASIDRASDRWCGTGHVAAPQRRAL